MLHLPLHLKNGNMRIPHAKTSIFKRRNG